MCRIWGRIKKIKSKDILKVLEYVIRYCKKVYVRSRYKYGNLSVVQNLETKRTCHVEHAIGQKNLRETACAY